VYACRLVCYADETLIHRMFCEMDAERQLIDELFYRQWGGRLAQAVSERGAEGIDDHNDQVDRDNKGKEPVL